jgi:hypothetical protein
MNARNVYNNNVSAGSNHFDVESRLNDASLYTGGQIKPKNKETGVFESEYKRVLTRRKSRQSVHAPTVIDIDYVGNSAGFAHLINKNGTSSNINFSMNLRNYKNDLDFKGKEPFIYPQKREFRPEE